MKKHLLPLLLVLAYQKTNAQAIAHLDGNKIKATINTNGFLFQDLTSGNSGFEAPSGSGLNTIFAASLCIGGQNSGIVYSATKIYAYSGDFQPGPVMDPVHYAARAPYWNHLWHVTQNDIYDHLANYTTPGYVPAPAIAQWPGNGDATYGEPAIVAPFFDTNGNGIYEPLLGDYPQIMGTEAIYQVMNDDDPAIGFTNTAPMKVEIHCMAYVFNCENDSALQNTVFLHYSIINRSTTTFTDVYTGFVSDFDISYGLDDFVGCDVSRGTFYGYNADTFAKGSSSAGYDSLLPIQGITLLAGPYKDDDGLDNPIETDYTTATAQGGIAYAGLGHGYADGTPDNERLGLNKFMYYSGVGVPNPNMSDPDNGTQMYNYLKGLWRDANQVYSGGTGYPGLPYVSTIASDYAFPGNSDPYNWSTRGVTAATWTEENNVPGDRRGLGISGPFTMEPGGHDEIDIALTFACEYSYTHDSLSALPLLQQRVDDIRSYFNSGTTPCGDFLFNSISENKQEMAFDVYPNPVSGQLTISLPVSANLVYTIHDVAGKQVMNGKINGSKTIVDLSTLENGVYYIAIPGLSSARVIVQR